MTGNSGRIDELRNISASLKKKANELTALTATITGVERAASRIGKSSSGSWIGYQSRVYYSNFGSIPPGARFNPEWGLFLDHTIVRATGGLSGSPGDWREYSTEEVTKKIDDEAGNVQLDLAKSKAAFEEFRIAKSNLASIIEVQRLSHWDNHLESIEQSVKSIQHEEAQMIASKQAPAANFMCRDQRAMAEGLTVPPHVMLIAQMMVIRNSFTLCDALANLVDSMASHLERIAVGDVVQQKSNRKIFIGHGKSAAWRDLRDFLKEKLHLPVEEFNSSPAAGMTTVERLSEMLDASAFAFLVMTGEDETASGLMQARLNVVHEMGLFQGRLGFRRAIVLLENGCEEFSNICGLTQIRFPKGNIKAVSEDVRDVLEREGLISKTQ